MAESSSQRENERVHARLRHHAQATRDVIMYIEGFTTAAPPLSAWLPTAQRGPLRLPTARPRSIKNQPIPLSENPAAAQFSLGNFS